MNTSGEAEDSYRVTELACSGCRVATASSGHLSLLIEVTESGASNPRALPNFHYRPPRAVAIEAGSRRRVERVATLTCGSKEKATESAFVRIAAACLDTRGARLTEGELEGRVDDFARVFGALGRPPTQTVEALWSKLAIVLWSKDVRLALASWQSNPRAIETLEQGLTRLHVKTSGVDRREHAVRLEELAEPAGGRTVLVSMVPKEDCSGETVADLREAILERVDGDVDARRRLEALVTLSLGQSWREAGDLRFSLKDARRQLRIFDSRDVPTVPQPVSLGLRDVCFVVDLRDTDPMPLAAARGLGSFFRGVLPAAG